jgi:diacylglycerol kinase (ATP)
LIRLIANPAAGRGRARRMIAAAHAALTSVGDVELRETALPGDEERLANDALDAGCTTIVALGGDGTWSKVAAALVARRSDCRLALLAAGTGNDLAKSLGLPANDPVATARLVAGNGEHRIDVGFADDRCFVNSIGFGFDAAVLAAAAGRAWPRGDAVYIAVALEQLFGYRGIDISADGSPLRTHLMLVIANGARFGGSFRIAPHADLSDGALDMVAIANASALRRLQLFGAAMRGTHVGMAETSTRRITGVDLRFSEPPAYDADGELCQASGTTVSIRCAPRALCIATAARDRAGGPIESAR